MKQYNDMVIVGFLWTVYFIFFPAKQYLSTLLNNKLMCIYTAFITTGLKRIENDSTAIAFLSYGVSLEISITAHSGYPICVSHGYIVTHTVNSKKENSLGSFRIS